MKQLFCLIVTVSLLCLLGVASVSADDDHIGGIQLLPGYEHQPLQGIDSIVGEISKKDGLQIRYEIGAIPKPGSLFMLGGMFSDRPKTTPKDKVRWYREQVVNGQPVHLAFRKDQVLLVSYPQKGINFHVTVRTADEMADALLMILTYPGPAADDAPARQ